MDIDRDFDELTDEEKDEAFVNYIGDRGYLYNSEDILMTLEFRKKGFERAAKIKPEGTLKNYYVNMAKILDESMARIQCMRLIDMEGNLIDIYDHWYYTVDTTVEKGVVLYLKHLNAFYGDDENTDITFECILYPSKMYSVSEYAEKYGIQPVTVRQWIRRGKLKEALKYGNEWMISELVPPVVTRGFVGGSYSCEEPYTGAPEEFSFLNGHTKFNIVKDPENKGHYKLEFERPDIYEKSFTVSEKEQLEYYMISDRRFNTRTSSISYPHLKYEEWDRIWAEEDEEDEE